MLQLFKENCHSGLLIVIALLFHGCTLNSIPFPPNEIKLKQPEGSIIEFSNPEKLNISDSFGKVNLKAQNLNLSKLPLPKTDEPDLNFSLEKSSVDDSFRYSELPDSEFNYDGLKSKPLIFSISKLDPPITVKAGPPQIGDEKSTLTYKLGERERLEGNNVTCTFKDRSGFLWIATEEGLYRYDGENLLLFFKLSFPTLIHNILEDHEGNIWFTEQDNYGIYDSQIFILDLKSALIEHLENYIPMEDRFYLAIFIDKQDRVWISEISGQIDIIDKKRTFIRYFDAANDTATSLPSPSSFSKLLMSRKTVFGISQDDSDNIWMKTVREGMMIIDIKNRKIRFLKTAHFLQPDADSISNLIRTARYFRTQSLKINNNRLWMLTQLPGELIEIDIQKGTVQYFSDNNKQRNTFLTAIFIDKQGTLWTSSISNVKNQMSTSITLLFPNSGRTKFISSNFPEKTFISTFTQDNLGQVWIGTSNGLYMVNRNGIKTEHIGNEMINAFAEDSNGRFWIALERVNSSIQIIDPDTKELKVFKNHDGLRGDSVNNIVSDGSNVAILSNKGIDLIDVIHGTIGKVEIQNFNSTTISYLVKDKAGRLWLSDDTSLNILDLRNGKFYKNITQGIKANIRITNIRIDQDGLIWISDYVGLIYVIDPFKNTIKFILNALPELTDGGFKLLLPDKFGSMWIGTGSNIYVVNKMRDSILRFSAQEALNSQFIYSINEYDSNIYVGTNYGVRIIKPPTLTKKVWQVQSESNMYGYNNDISALNSTIVVKNSQFLFVNKGITVVNKALENAIPPKTYISGIDVFNKPIYFANNEKKYKIDTQHLIGKLPKKIKNSEQEKMHWDSVNDSYNLPINLKLPYYQNYLQFHFLQANMGANNTVWYRYLLQGTDQNWSEETTNTISKNYINLSPGNYSFKVASMYKGIWSKPTEFQFTIEPPWYETFWAYTLYLLIFFATIWIFGHFRTIKLRRANQRLEEKIAHRTEQLQQSLENLKSTQALLIQSEKMASLGELTAGIAHEIQNPLNFVNNFSEVNQELLEEMESEMIKGNLDDVKSMVKEIIDNEQKINQHGKRADAIVKGMLQHSRSSTGIKEPTDINKLADEHLRLSYHGLTAKDKSFNPEMKTDFDNSIGKINIIPQDIGRVLLNLYNNAFYAVNEKKKQQTEDYQPTVSVSSKMMGDNVITAVKDNGNGIPQKTIDKIFQPFFTTKPTGEGTGLGLSLSYDIIKAHGGEI